MSDSSSMPMMRACVLAMFAIAASGCAPSRLTAPGAAGLPPEQSAWVITHDYVRLVALDGTQISRGFALVNDALADGVGVTMQMAPGTHELELAFDNGARRSAGTTKIRLDTKAGNTYYIKDMGGMSIRYAVFPYSSVPTKELLKKFDVQGSLPPES